MNESSLLPLVATTAFGLEAVTARELQQLGLETEIVGSGRVRFQGGYRDLLKANLWLRTADRILIEVAKIPAGDFDALFEGVKNLAWEEYLGPEAGFPVKGRSYQSQLTSVPAVQRSTKRAIVERLRTAHGVLELPESGPSYSIHVALAKDEATLSIDSSGAGLSQRGYLDAERRSPLKSTLAAALVQLSHWNRDRPLVDPFCGSGVLLVEAALIAKNIAPGLLREFACTKWSQVDPQWWEELLENARSQVIETLPETIIGYDDDPSALRLARQHAIAAGVDRDIHFQQQPFNELTSKRRFGCVITSPPYDDHPRARREQWERYQAFPQVLRRLPTWSHFIFTPFPDFERVLGQEANRRRKLYHGRIESHYYQFFGPPPPRAASTPPSESSQDQTAIAEPPAETPAALPDVATPTESAPPDVPIADTPAVDTPAVDTPVVDTPVVDTPVADTPVADTPVADTPVADTPVADTPVADTPVVDTPVVDTPVVDTPVVETPAIETPAAEPKPRRTMTPAFGGLDAKAKEQAQLLKNRLVKRARHFRRWPKRGVHCIRLYERDIPEIPLVIDRYHDYLHITDYDRPHDRTPAQYADWLDNLAEAAREALEIPEGHVFVKHRTRQSGNTQHEKVSDESQIIHAEEGGLKFEVNLSDYVDTGLFLDHRNLRSQFRDEAAGKRVLNLFCYTGAFSVYAAAGGAASTTNVDLSANYLDWAGRNFQLNGLSIAKHRFIRSDVMEFLRNHPPGQHYDLAIVDVPTFSNSKRTDDVWDVQEDHVELLRRAIGLMSPTGVLYFSNNFRRFKLDEEALSGIQIREISKHTVPEDFRNQRIHRCWRLGALPPKVSPPSAT